MAGHERSKLLNWIAQKHADRLPDAESTLAGQAKEPIINIPNVLVKVINIRRAIGGHQK